MDLSVVFPFALREENICVVKHGKSTGGKPAGF